MKKYKFLITGADFRNKGGQSMLFITIDELKKRFPGCEIFYPTNQKQDENFAVNQIYYDFNSLMYMDGGKDRLKAIGKGIVKLAAGKKGNIFDICKLGKVFPSFDAVIDISGFNLSSKWPAKTNKKYLTYIKMARKYHIPSFIMPQSFGPFDYGERQKEMDARICDIMSWPEVVYAREHEGERLMEEKYQLRNIRYSCDLVLQNRGIDIKNVYKNAPKLNIPEIEAGSVAVIPNMRSFDHGNREAILDCYRAMIEKLLRMGKKIYIFRHAGEDLEACRWIKEIFPQQKDVILLEDDFNCLEYDQFIEKFDYVIGSRFHAIVHALRKGVPAIALGWAVKYEELLKLFGLEKYVFNLTKSVRPEEILAAIDVYENDRKNLEAHIRTALEEIQRDNCFDILTQYFEA